MKPILYILSIILLFSCKTEKEINKSVPYNDSVILLGQINKKGFEQPPYNQWYNSNYEEYELNYDDISKLEELTEDVKIVTFMGTWCGDSKRETPVFIKILDSLDFKTKKHKMYAVSREKTTPGKAEANLNITNVPTFIFYDKDGKEINRIVEYPIETLEKDMIKILSGEDYTHAYAE